MLARASAQISLRCSPDPSRVRGVRVRHHGQRVHDCVGTAGRAAATAASVRRHGAGTHRSPGCRQKSAALPSAAQPGRGTRCEYAPGAGDQRVQVPQTSRFRSYLPHPSPIPLARFVAQDGTDRANPKPMARFVAQDGTDRANPRPFQSPPRVTLMVRCLPLLSTISTSILSPG